MRVEREHLKPGEIPQSRTAALMINIYIRARFFLRQMGRRGGWSRVEWKSEGIWRGFFFFRLWYVWMINALLGNFF